MLELAPTTPLNRFAAEWNQLRPDLPLSTQKGRATHANVRKIRDGVWFQVLYRAGRQSPRLEVGLAFDSMDPDLNKQNRDRLKVMLGELGEDLTERGEVVKYLVKSLLVQEGIDVYRQAAAALQRLLEAWERHSRALSESRAR